jgi:hypothetical protein
VNYAEDEAITSINNLSESPGIETSRQLYYLGYIIAPGAVTILHRESKIDELEMASLVRNDVISFEVVVVKFAIVKLLHELTETTAAKKGLVSWCISY